jgi:hypothetical protein
VKTRFDDRVITVRDIVLERGGTIPTGTHGLVIEALESPDRYEVEFDLESGQVLATVVPEDIGPARNVTHSRRTGAPLTHWLAGTKVSVCR